MAEIQQLLKMLQSDDPRVRYDACEELGAMPVLPPQAIDAIYPLTIDANQDVADAAQRAIKLHNRDKVSAETVNEDIENQKRKVGPDGLIIVLGSAVLTNLIFVILIRGFDSGELWARFMIGAIPSVVFSMIGYFVWLRSWRKRDVEWELKSVFINLIMVGFFAGLLPGLCAAGMSS